jgi:tRNA(Ile)-lysidine synthase TilS/MesJ
MNRCRTCILPENYPGIRFDDHGVCSICRSSETVFYQGTSALKDAILKAGNRFPEREYDCAIGFSGGRDSSYLLYTLKKTLGLKVLAVTVDNGFIPEETKENIRKITKALSVDLVEKKYDYLRRHLRRHLRIWTRRPTVAMVTSLCVGCRLGIHQAMYETMKERNIPVLVLGATPFEGKQFKTKLLYADADNRSWFSLLKGYVRQVLKNPHWLLNPASLMMQYREANAVFNKSLLNRIKRSGKKIISPYRKYIHWQEKEIVRTIEMELDWKKNPSTKSTWRGDCDLALLKLYIYRKMLGFNDKDDALSDLIRDRQITREDALHRLQDEQYVPDSVIREVLDENGIGYEYFMKQIEKAMHAGG